MAKRIDFGKDGLLSSQSSIIDEEEMIEMENSAVPEYIKGNQKRREKICRVD